MIDKSFKYFKWFFYFLLIISMIFSLIDKVHAQDYNVYQAEIKVNLYRAMYGSGYLDSNNGQFSTSIASINRIRVFFTTNQYFGYKDKFYLFSGHIENFGANATIIASNYYDGSTIKGACETTIYGTGQFQAFNTKCFIPDGLRNGNYNNILEFVFADNGVTPTNSLNSEIYIDPYVPMIDNYYVAKNDTSNITNAINNQSQQQHQDSINTQNKLNDINNTMNNGSIDNPSNNTSNWGNMNASNGVITNLLTLPIQLMQGYVNGLNSSCTPFNLGNLFGTNITLPCINIGNLIGSSLWGVIDVLFSGFMIFGIAKKLIKIFNDFTNMRGNQVDELYGGGA